MNASKVQSAADVPQRQPGGAAPPWRPEVEGLRGFAVLAVMMFHAVPAWLPGGFTGVDVFFVLSGFVVGRMILADLAQGRFAFVEFYARRARRIVPALTLVLAATLALAPLFIGGEDLVALGQQATAAVLFVPNFLAWRQSGYFDGDAAYRPLIHLWSLGVEEQFYAFLPLVLALLWRTSRPAIGVWLAALATASFLACGVATLHGGGIAFYLPVFRFWELLVGTLLAWRETTPGASRRGANGMLAVAGFVLLLASVGCLSESRHFPGWLAAIPVLGTVLILAAGPDAATNRLLLCRGVLPWLGRISYAAYLWHWPIFVFARYRFGGPPPPATSLLLVIASVVLAYCSTRFVENPIRFGKWRWPQSLRKLFWVTGLSGAVLVAVGMIYRPLGYSPPELKRLENYAGPGHDIWREGRNCFVNLDNEAQFGADCLGGAGERPLLALWGDSYAAHLWPGLQKEANARGWRLAQLTISQCPALIHSVGERNVKCEVMRTRALEGIRAIAPHTVVLSSRWTDYDLKAELESIGPTIESLRAGGAARVVVIGPSPRWQPSLARALAEDMRRKHLLEVPAHTAIGYEAEAHGIESLLRQATLRAGGSYVSALDAMCLQPGLCKTWIDEDTRQVLAIYDSGHLSEPGSEWLAGRIGQEVFRR